MAYNPPIGSIYHLYTTYILPSGGLYATYHLLGEPETTIEEMIQMILQIFQSRFDTDQILLVEQMVGSFGEPWKKKQFRHVFHRILSLIMGALFLEDQYEPGSINSLYWGWSSNL